jgi:Secretion system C-terminal sorting domain
VNHDIKIFLVLIITGCCTSFAQTNLLGKYNGGFESGLISWRFFEVPKSLGSTAVVESTDVAQGTKAVKLTFIQPDSTLQDRALDNWDDNVGVAPRGSYSASVQAKTTTPGNLKIRITFGFFDNGRSVITQVGKDSLLTNSYQTFSVNDTAPSNASTCWIAFRLVDSSGKQAAGTLLLDDAEILGPSATSPTDTTYPPDPPLDSGYTQVDRSTLTGKVMCGYQGWFAVPSDPINRGWYHYQLNNTFAPGSCSIDLWPDMSDMDSDEKYAPPGFVTQSGAQAYVFSSQNRKTVLRHFKWMADYGIDGVFIQRFAAEVFNGGPGLKQFNNVLANCKAGAHKYGRTFAIMYDLSGMQAGEWKKVLADWRTQIVDKKILQDSCYLYHNGKPVVAVWGIGFNDGRQYTLAECSELIDSLKYNPQYGGNTIMIGVPKGWRTLSDDALNDTTLTAIARKADIISPWFVGRYSAPSDVNSFANTDVSPDRSWCVNNNKDYLPVVFPGFSWHNMNPGSPLNQIPRLGGNFLWSQFYNYLRVGVKMIYVAMFDEMDEGTAIFKCTNDPPVGASNFVTYEGLPSDQYLWLTGQGKLMLDKEIPSSSTLPTRTTGVNNQEIELPGKYKLEQNYPNPFNPTTIISYSIPKTSFVTIKVYNVLGGVVETLVNKEKKVGNYKIELNGGRLASGIYFYKMQAGNFVETKKLILLK